MLARCFQLQDGLDILEIDRVLDSSPDDVDRHRTALRAAKRRDDISKSTARLLSRMDAAAAGANEQVLLHPLKAGRVVRSGNEVAGDVLVFHEKLGITGERSAITAKPWREAVGDARDNAVEITERSAKAVGDFSVKTFEGAMVSAEKLVDSAAERLPWRRRKADRDAEDDGQ